MLMRRLGAEAFGAFWLVFAGTGAAVVNEATNGVVTHVGVALFAGPVCGASMNPARSLAPALVSMQLDAVWIYLVAPTAGALASVPFQRWLHGSPGRPRAGGAGHGDGMPGA